MESDRSRRVEELFQQALELPRAERAGFLEGLRSEAPEVVDEVRSLLGHHSAEFLEDPEHLPHEAGPTVTDPERIGPYRVVRPLGQGGMGVVYLAQQEHPVRRPVALKLIKLGMDTAKVVARFGAERQALAMMNHPNIAHVYDAGSTETGRPYFVMEYIEDGTPITTYCDEHGLDVRRRLELFSQVCEGLQHAHQKGIIHQDIKPSNVLITVQGESPVPKIIDFGIARATDQHQAEATAFTELGQIVGTPDYMSPEQTQWGHPDIDTRTDVYSLGVLLYELLAGARPFEASELRKAGLEELCRIIRETEPPRPSTRLHGLGDRLAAVAAARRADPALLVRQVKGDLDWITLQALARDRERRYATTTELAADIRRHLAHEPVLARPPGAVYRTIKFVQRHRIGVAAAAVVLLALVVGFIGTTVGMIRAQRAEAVSREIEGFMVGSFEGADPSHSRGETITAREILDNSADRIREEFEGEPQIKGRLLLAMGRSYRGLGLYPQAEPLLRESLRLLKDAQGATHPDVAIALNGLANVLVVDQRYEEAVPLYEEALGIWQRVKDPDDPHLATLLKHLGDAHAKLGDFDRSRSYLERAIEIHRRSGSGNLAFAKSLSGFGDMLARAGDPEAAIPFMEESLRIREQVSASPDDAAIGFGHYYLGDALFRAGEYASAAEHLRAALEIWAAILGWEHVQVGACAYRLAEALEGASDLEGADRYYRRALEADEAVFGSGDPDLLEALEGYAGFLRRTGRDAEAAPLEARAAEIRRSAGQAP